MTRLADRILRRNFEAKEVAEHELVRKSAVDKCEVNKFETSTMAHKNKRKSEAKFGTSTKSTEVEDASTSTRKTKQFKSAEFTSSNVVAKAAKQAVDRLGASPTLSAKEIVDSAEKVEVVRVEKNWL